MGHTHSSIHTVYIRVENLTAWFRHDGKAVTFTSQDMVELHEMLEWYRLNRAPARMVAIDPAETAPPDEGV